VKQYGLEQDSRMAVYFPHKQQRGNGMYVVARTTVDPESVARAMIGEVHAIDHDAPVYDVSTMENRLYRSLARQRFSTATLVALAGFAMILAAVGVYGVLSYMVAQGARDIGVRMALGAQERSILRLVVRHGMGLTLVGIGVGLAGAIGLTRVMASLLYGVSATDLLTFCGVAAVLGLVALSACYIPARRAMRIDPMAALRCE
jgi:ABC-type antimicrobial peptide transport system permease subunit